MERKEKWRKQLGVQLRFGKLAGCGTLLASRFRGLMYHMMQPVSTDSIDVVYIPSWPTLYRAKPWDRVL